MVSDQTPVFIDMSALKALIDESDDFHTRAGITWQMLKQQQCPLVSSNYILDEAFTLIRKRCGLLKVEQLRSLLAVSAQIFYIARVTIDDEGEAWQWFTKQWSDLSFTDCVCFAQMKRLSIAYAFSFDNHFRRAGYKLV